MILHTQLWKTLALRGLCAVLFGLLAIGWPAMTLAALIVIFGLYALADGLIATALAFKTEGWTRLRWLLLLSGLAGILVGLVACLLPLDSAAFLVFLIGLWALVTGLFEIVAAFELRRTIQDDWLISQDGWLSVLWGLTMILFPRALLLAVAWIVGALALAYGIFLLYLAYRINTRQGRRLLV